MSVKNLDATAWLLPKVTAETRAKMGQMHQHAWVLYRKIMPVKLPTLRHCAPPLMMVYRGRQRCEILYNSQFTRTLLMAYSKAKLKTNGDRASPCFKPFQIGNMSDKFSPTRTLHYASVRHTFISLTSFVGIQKLNENTTQDHPSNWIINFCSQISMGARSGWRYTESVIIEDDCISLD